MLKIFEGYVSLVVLVLVYVFIVFLLNFVLGGGCKLGGLI